jgi:primosomal protein N' (replication factor Y)
MARAGEEPELFVTEKQMPSATAFALVAVERGVDVPEGGLWYAVSGSEMSAVGDRVTVPLGRGNKPASGFVVEVTAQRPEGIKHLKAITRREREGASLTPELVALAKWIAGYYVCPLGMVLTSMLPAAVKHGTGTRRRTLVRLGEPLLTKPTKLQQQLLEALKQHDGWVEVKQLADEAGAKTTGSVQRLIDVGALESRSIDAVDAEMDLPVDPPRSVVKLTEHQAYALHAIEKSLGSFGTHLLHGVTGSGKTEVYLRLIETLRSRDPQAGVIVLVPEIALTPQTVRRLASRFTQYERPTGGVGGSGGGGVAVLHSGLTPAQRHAQWTRIHRGLANIVVGARSAVFAPLNKLGLVIVDEEHDTSYKADQLPRYHGRDVAIKRAQLAGCPVVLGSATPALESYHNAVVGQGVQTSAGPARPGSLEMRAAPRSCLITLPDRVPGATLPRVEIVDLVQERRQRRGIHLLSQRLEHLLLSTVMSKRQAVVLLNRRGYANYVSCPDHNCGWLMGCDHCDALMVYHLDEATPSGGVVKCHHCNTEKLVPGNCPWCGKLVNKFGLGTQRVEEEIARKLPGARIARMDADAIRTGRDYHDTLDAFAQGRIDVLLGTQMIGKGLDVANVKLVGVITADVSLHLPDFRGAERTFQTIAQVAGRAGRGSEPGIVVVQTFNPNDPTIQLASKHDYVGFATRELAIRKVAKLPPFARMARIVCRDRKEQQATQRAYELAGSLRRVNEDLQAGVQVRGPAPCARARIADHYRLEVVLIAEHAVGLQKVLTALRNAKLAVSDARTAIDVDPVAML